jgi:hypothetical protein
MQHLGNRHLRIVLVILAVLLSAFDGILNMLSVLVFTGNESGLVWLSIKLPAVLWIAALACLKFPRGGLVVFVVVLLGACFLCVDPMHHSHEGLGPWKQCASNLRFAFAGGALLLVSLAFSKQSD